MEITRRTILRGMAAAPVAGRAVLGEVSSRLAGLGAPLGHRIPSEGTQADKASKFWNFATWFKRDGERYIRAQARDVERLDPDIYCLHSASLWTKVRMQRERNYTRLLLERKNWFGRSVASNGFVEWWP